MRHATTRIFPHFFRTFQVGNYSVPHLWLSERVVIVVVKVALQRGDFTIISLSVFRIFYYLFSAPLLSVSAPLLSVLHPYYLFVSDEAMPLIDYPDYVAVFDATLLW
jgi:hypothetical protein